MANKVWKSKGKSDAMLVLLHVEVDGVQFQAPVWRGRNGRAANVGQWEQVIPTESGEVTLPAEMPRLDMETRKELVKVLGGSE